MKRIFTLIAIFAATLTCWAQSSKNQPLNILISHNSRPYSYADTNGKLLGYVPDFFDILMGKMGKDYHFVCDIIVPGNAKRKMLDNLDHCDLMAFAVSPKETDLNNHIYYSTPYLRIDFILATKKRTTGELPRYYNNKKMVVVRNSLAQFAISKMQFRGQLVIASTTKQAIDMVQNGTVDYFALSSNMPEMREDLFSKCNLHISMSNIPSVDGSVASKNKELIAQMDQVIGQMHADGTIVELDKEWFKHYEDSSEKELLFTIIGILVMIAIVLFLMVQVHRRAVKKAIANAQVTLQHNQELIRTIPLLLQNDNYEVFLYDIRKQELKKLTSNGFEQCAKERLSATNGLNSDELARYNSLIQKIKNKTEFQEAFTLRIKDANEEYKHYTHVIKSIVNKGEATQYLMTRCDVSRQEIELQNKHKMINDLQLSMQLTNTSRWKYNPQAQTLRLTDPDGNKQTISYDSVKDRMKIEGVDLIEQYIQDVLTGQSLGITTLTIQDEHNSNEHRYYQINSRVGVDKKTNLPIIRGVITDITEKQKQQLQIGQLQQNINLALDAGELNLWAYNPCTDQFTHIHNNTVDTVNILSRAEYYAFVHPHDIQLLTDTLAKIIDKEIQNTTLRIRIKGRLRFQWMVFHLAPTIGENGEVETITAVQQNIQTIVEYEEKLKKEQRKLQDVIDGLPVPIYIIEPDSQTIVYYNEQASRNFFIGQQTKSILDLFIAESNQRCIEINNKVMDLREEYKAPENVTLKNGELRNTFVQKRIMRYNGSDHILVVRYDQTEQQKMKESEQLFLSSLPMLKAYTWQVNGLTRSISYHSAVPEEQQKLSKLGTMEQRVSTIHPDDQQYFLDTLNHQIEHGDGPFYMSYRSKLSSGELYQWWEVRAIAQRTEVDGKKYILLNGISINVHQQRQNELELKRINRQNQIILNNSSSGIIYVNSKNEVQWSNMTKDQQDLITTYLLQTKDIYTSPAENTSIYEKLTADDQQIYDLWITPTVNNGQYQGTVIRVDNVTERELMIHDLEIAKDKAEESERLKMAFLANMSHEIRTPLNAIVGFSELLFDTEEKEEKEEYITLIKQNNENLLRLIGDILDLSKIESGNIEINPVEIEFSHYFDGIYTIWQQRSVETGVELIKQNPYNYCMVMLDHKQVNQIVTNFISNAFKYCPTGSITIGYEYIDEGIKIYVKDTGIGIEEEKLQLTFGRFSKLDNFAQGTGLGLSICKALAEAVGGKVGVESKYGVGSIFWVWLPTKAEIKKRQAKQVIQADKNPIVENTSTSQDKEILIAEDNDSNYTLLEALLKQDYKLTRAKNGLEAVEQARQNTYYAILMDMQMPIMGGVEAIQNIRTFNTKIPIITLTGNAFDYDREAAMAAGSNLFMTKPIKRQELLGALKDVRFLNNEKTQQNEQQNT